MPYLVLLTKHNRIKGKEEGITAVGNFRMIRVAIWSSTSSSMPDHSISKAMWAHSQSLFADVVEHLLAVLEQNELVVHFLSNIAISLLEC